jgi:tripartite-type tricarboxylate transporter receptor subunit TctC
VIQTPNYITDKKLKPLVVDGLTRDPLLPDVPTLLELAPTEAQKSAVRLISGSSEFARAYFLPPGVPEDRVAALRRAFDETMKDPEFLAEAKKLKMTIEPQNGEALDKTAAQIIASPSAAVALAKKLLGG